jgi:hypothetical protein
MPLPQSPELPRAVQRFQSTLIGLFCLLFVALPLLFAACTISFVWLAWQMSEAFRLQEEQARARQRGPPPLPGGARDWTIEYPPLYPGQEYPLTPPSTRQDREREWEISSLRERAMLAHPFPVIEHAQGDGDGDGELSRRSSGRRVSFQLDEAVEEAKRGRAREGRGEHAPRNDHEHEGDASGEGTGGAREDSRITSID